MHIDKLDDIVNKSNNTYHSTIKINPVDVKQITYIGFLKENNKGDSKFEVGVNVRISKYENILAKSFTLRGSDKAFLIKKLKTLCRAQNRNF